ATVAGMKKSRSHLPVLAEQVRSTIEGITFADAPEIDFHARLPVPHRAIAAVENNLAHAHALQGLGPLRCGGNSLATAVKAPGLDQRTGRDVKSARRVLRDACRVLD